MGETFQIADSNVRFHEERVIETGGVMYKHPNSIRLGQSLSFSWLCLRHQQMKRVWLNRIITTTHQSSSHPSAYSLLWIYARRWKYEVCNRGSDSLRRTVTQCCNLWFPKTSYIFRGRVF